MFHGLLTRATFPEIIPLMNCFKTTVLTQPNGQLIMGLLQSAFHLTTLLLGQ